VGKIVAYIPSGLSLTPPLETKHIFASLCRQKLSELDEITHRLKKRLHFVTHEGSTPSFLPQMQETEIPFMSEMASNNVLNMDMSKNFRSKVSPVNEEGNSDLDNTVADPAGVTAGYFKFSKNSNDTEKLNLEVAEENYKIPRISSQKCGNVKNSLAYSLPGNNFVHTSISSTNSYPLPQSDVTSVLGYLEKGSTNPEVRRTAVNHTSSLAHCTYPYDSSSCKKISSHLRTRYKIHENWNAGVSKTVSNGTRLPVKMRSEVEDADDFDKLTRYLMETSAREFDLENVFNPLLFHHLLTLCTDTCISGFGKHHHVECYHVSPVVSTNTQPSKYMIKNCNDYEDDTTFRNIEVDIARSQYLINSIEDNCDMNEVGTLERNVNVAEDNRTWFQTDGEIVANISSSSDMNSVSVMEVSNANHSVPYDISLDINKQQDTIGDIKHSCACLPCVCANSQYQTGNRAISEWQTSHTVGNTSDVFSRTGSSSDVFLSNCSVNKLEFSRGVDLDKTSRDAELILRQAPEGGDTTEEKRTMNVDTVLEDSIETFRIRTLFHSIKGKKTRRGK
jgi:hypothetical protein